jgi:RNA polymerase sigma factor (sigma-70 family)
MQTHMSGSELTANPLLPLLGAGFVQGLCRRAARTAPADLREECESEAWLVLWQAHEKLRALPEGERRAYAAVCVRHRLGQLCRRERQRQALLVSWDVLQSGALSRAEIERQPEPGREPSRSAHLLDQIDRADLAAALLVLPQRDRHLLDLYYVQQLTDVEIARRWEATAGAVKMQRHRAIVKLRRALCRNGGT